LADDLVVVLMKPLLARLHGFRGCILEVNTLSRESGEAIKIRMP